MNADNRETLAPLDATRTLALPVTAAVVLGAAVLLLDNPIRDAIRGLPIGGDVKREFESLQQFGGLTSIAVVALVIALLQPARLRRVLDWLAAVALGSLLFNAMKVATGRLRPRITTEDAWIGPLGKFDAGHAIVHPYEFWKPDVFASLSMPSTHTTHAAIAGVFLAHMYPPLRFLVWPWVAIVALARVYFGSHWPSDVVVGACLGFALGSVVVNRYWGVRALDWVWVRVVDRKASPAFPASRRADLEAWARADAD